MDQERKEPGIFQALFLFSRSGRYGLMTIQTKCAAKLRDGDYTGAITNARSLCEDVLRDVETQRTQNAAAYDGDLPKLYKRVRRLLNLDPDGYVEHGAVLQLLRGLTGVVGGIAGVSNNLGDRDGGRRIRPKAHHAQLAVNAANTL
jgi:hypothetical protein